MALYEFKGHQNLCGENIRRLRKAKGMSQKDLAAKLQVQELMLESNNISKIELGRRFVLDYELRVFARVLGVEMIDLLQIPEDIDE